MSSEAWSELTSACYVLLLSVRINLALAPSYIHPDEHFQGPEVVAGQSERVFDRVYILTRLTRSTAQLEVATYLGIHVRPANTKLLSPSALLRSANASGRVVDCAFAPESSRHVQVPPIGFPGLEHRIG